MATCPSCGQENKDEARFCIKCGSALGAPAQPAAGTPPAGTPQVQPPATPPPQAAPIAAPPAQPTYQQPTYQQPTYQQPTAYPQAPPTQPVSPYAYTQPGYQAGAAYPAAAAYARPVEGRKPVFWVGSAIVVLSGIMVLVSSFMSFVSDLDATGWDFVKYGEGSEKFYVDLLAGHPFFTGLVSLIVGILILIAGGLMFAARNKGISAMAIIFSFIAMGLAITNLVSIIRLEGSPGAGIYVFLIFSILGLVGGTLGANG